YDQFDIFSGGTAHRLARLREVRCNVTKGTVHLGQGDLHHLPHSLMHVQGTPLKEVLQFADRFGELAGEQGHLMTGWARRAQVQLQTAWMHHVTDADAPAGSRPETAKQDVGR